MCPVRCPFTYVSCDAEYIVYDSIDKMPHGRSSLLRTSCLKTKSGRGLDKSRGPVHTITVVYETLFHGVPERAEAGDKCRKRQTVP